MSTTIEVDGRSVEVSREDKVLFPEDGVTKGDLIEYYRRVAPVMLRHLRDRPLVMQRFPDGIDGEGFYQKDTPEYFPDWIERVSVEKEGGTVEHVVCSAAADLVYLADQACITPHVWLSTVGDLRRPDRLVFDLDPPNGDAGPVRRAARDVRDLVDEIGLVPFLMTTGSRGYHVVVPIRREMGFDDARRLARDAARVLAARRPEELTVEQRKEKRGDRVFVDYLRNSYAQTQVAPYAVRARPGAPVATPIDWDELGSVDPRRYDIDAALRRLRQKDDPWEDLPRHARAFDGPRAALDRLLDESGGQRQGDEG
ncbi:MAG: non-homologous end-joining DNA ligase [Thermoleophilia bacterium]|nr:non-homologous end-joining DNA ligase [Thermoleophilia bacterium]